MMLDASRKQNATLDARWVMRECMSVDGEGVVEDDAVEVDGPAKEETAWAAEVPAAEAAAGAEAGPPVSPRASNDNGEEDGEDSQS